MAETYYFIGYIRTQTVRIQKLYYRSKACSSHVFSYLQWETKPTEAMVLKRRLYISLTKVGIIPERKHRRPGPIDSPKRFSRKKIPLPQVDRPGVTKLKTERYIINIVVSQKHGPRRKKHTSTTCTAFDSTTTVYQRAGVHSRRGSTMPTPYRRVYNRTQIGRGVFA